MCTLQLEFELIWGRPWVIICSWRGNFQIRVSDERGESLFSRPDSLCFVRVVTCLTHPALLFLRPSRHHMTSTPRERRLGLSTVTPNRLLARVVRASEAAYRGGFAIYDGREDGPDVRFDVNARPVYWARSACSMPLHFTARAYYIELLENKAKFYENRLLEFQKEEEDRREEEKDRQAKAKADHAAKEAEEAKAANEVKEAKEAEARRAKEEVRARLKTNGDELRKLVDTLQPVPSHKRKRTAVVSPPARKLWSLFG